MIKKKKRSHMSLNTYMTMREKNEERKKKESNLPVARDVEEWDE
jgi:hypothetical protein